MDGGTEAAVAAVIAAAFGAAATSKPPAPSGIGTDGLRFASQRETDRPPSTASTCPLT